MDFISRIKSIQNDSHSLEWGSHVHSEDEVMFVVYDVRCKKYHYFIVRNDCKSLILAEDRKDEYLFDGIDEVISQIARFISEWYPPNFLAEEVSDEEYDWMIDLSSSNPGGWSNSSLNSWLNSVWLESLLEDVAEFIDEICEGLNFIILEEYDDEDAEEE